MIRAGKLRHAVTIQAFTTGSPSRSATGAPDGAWSDVATGVRANIMPLIGKRLEAAQANYGRVNTEIQMRYRTDVSANMRVTYRGKVYSVITAFDPDLKEQELRLICFEGAGDG